MFNKEQPSMWWGPLEQGSKGRKGTQVSREVGEGRAQVSRELREGKGRQKS